MLVVYWGWTHHRDVSGLWLSLRIIGIYMLLITISLVCFYFFFFFILKKHTNTIPTEKSFDSMMTYRGIGMCQSWAYGHITSFWLVMLLHSAHLVKHSPCDLLSVKGHLNLQLWLIPADNNDRSTNAIPSITGSAIKLIYQTIIVRYYGLLFWYNVRCTILKWKC